jgi:stalled ribosome rescue protein Dom34
MKTNAGLWVDHRQAVIVILSDQGEEIKRIESHLEKHIRYSGASHSRTPTGHDDSAEDRRDRRFDDQLNRYYDEVISLLQNVDSILILGPGEAKGELQKRLEGQEARRRIVAIEAADKMTDGQIAAEVRQYFRGSVAHNG